MIRVALTLFVLLLTLSGCDAVQDFKQMGEKQSRVQALIEERYGWHANLGWNIHNAELTQVTLVLSAEEVADERVKTLQAIAKEAVAEVFASRPKAIYVTLVTNLDDD